MFTIRNIDRIDMPALVVYEVFPNTPQLERG